MIHVRDCQTAEEVRELARETARRRKVLWGGAMAPRLAPEPVPPLMMEAGPQPEPTPEPPPPPPLSVAVTVAGVTWHTPPEVVIMRLVARHYEGMTVALLKGRMRTKNVVWPRHVACWLCRRLLKEDRRSYPQIGRMFGGRDHTCVINAIGRVDRRRAYSPEFADELAVLEAEARAAIGWRA